MPDSMLDQDDTRRTTFPKVKKRAAAKQRTQERAKDAEDVRIQETNSSSIVSKRSVERLYYKDDPEWFCYFVSKLKRRSPPINRGYWLRMRAVEHTIEQFLLEPTEKRKIVVNLGCGYDPVPWLFLGGKRRSMCQNVKFVDVDYPLLMTKKMAMLSRTPQLTDILPDLTIASARSGLMCDSQDYAAVGCDLGQPELLKAIFSSSLGIDDSVAILFVAEVSVAYMDLPGSQAVIEWAASYKDARFCSLEQHLPDGKDHPFAQTMLRHFAKIGTPLRAVGTMAEMHGRFVQAGWPQEGVIIQSLWRLWSDPTFLSPEQRIALDEVEPFDEWEELALFASHYFLMVARTIPVQALPRRDDNTLARGAEITCKVQVEKSQEVRRFSTVIPPECDGSVAGITGGLGAEGRLAHTTPWSPSNGGALKPPPSDEGLLCQAAAKLGDTDDCLLIGGRASPCQVSQVCYLRKQGVWTRMQDLPVGLYRHCAVSYTYNSIPGVLVFGGKTANGAVSTTVFCFEEERGWYQLNSVGDVPSPRFGAAMDEQLLLGGMTADGVICKDVFQWTRSDTEISFQSIGTDYAELGRSLHRFGACLTSWHINGSWQKMLIGGVGSSDLLTRDNEILNLTTLSAHPIIGPRPLLVGFSLLDRTCVGGGATCFSFGTFWNSTYDLELSGEQTSPRPWRRQLDAATPDVATQNIEMFTPTVQVASMVVSDSFENFADLVQAGIPVKLKGLSLGPCLKKWSPDYLKQKLAQRQVVVHASDDLRLDFLTKNFQYITQGFGEFLAAASAGKPSYLRALSSAAPSKEPAKLSVDFPEIADDFRLPPALSLVAEREHSSVLRIAAAKTIMWLHYDVMANVLCQVKGKKTLYLYPPSDIENLGIGPGMSSSSFDVFGTDKSTHSSLRHCHAHEVTLGPGDVLFIPPLWSHTAKPTQGMSIAVNVFFRDLTHGYAAGRDVYGNRDLAAYEKGRKDVAMIAKAFAPLPASTRHFYLKRLAMELSSLADG